MMLLLIWVVASIAVGFVAGQRGRSGFGWFFFSMLLSPILCALLLLACPVLTRQAHDERCAGCRAKVGAADKFCVRCGRGLGLAAQVPVPRVATRDQASTWSLLFGSILILIAIGSMIAIGSSGDWSSAVRVSGLEAIVGAVLLLGGGRLRKRRAHVIASSSLEQ
jgi:hypothetical protein